MESYLQTGQIVSTHGVKGTVRVQPWADSAQVVADLPCVYVKCGAEYRPYPVLHGAVQNGMVLLTIEGCNTLDEAAAMKNTVLYAKRSDIPLQEGDYFIADLIGLSVTDADTRRIYGKIVNVYNRGASDIYEIEMPNRKIAYLPAVKEFVTATDLTAGIEVRPIPGIFDEWGEATDAL